MKMNKRKIFIGIFIVFFTIIFCLYIYHIRPLYESSGYVVTVEKEGVNYKATLYKMLFRPNVLFLYAQIDNNRYEWFTIDLKNKGIGIPNWPKRQPYLSFHADMELGVPIDCAKINDGWKSSWNNNMIKFSNDRINIMLEKIDL